MRVIDKNGVTFRVHTHVRHGGAATFDAPAPGALEARLKQFWDDAAHGIWEPETFRVMDRFIDPRHSYIDLGAWIGPTLLYGSQLARHAYGVEPDPVAHAALSANVELNPELKEKITLARLCIADSTGSVSLGNTGLFWGDSTSSMLLTSGGRSQEVDALTFEDFVERYGITDCNFIKMDIEGAEAVVIRSMSRYLKLAKPTLYLSLHVQLIYPRLGEIFDALGIYKNVFSESGERLDFGRLLKRARTQLHPYDRIVVTDREWE
jgi:FkbM family methyltransferase